MSAIAWCSDPRRIPELIEFFIANTGVEYISHGEIIDDRATGPHTWSPRLHDALMDEFSACDFDDPTGSGKRLAIADRDGTLAGLALVEFDGRTAFLHDLVVATNLRSHGLGGEILAWIERAAREAGCVRVVLESGVANAGAHRFFGRAGYEVISRVMLKPLSR